MSKVIILAGQEFVVVAPPFGKLRKIINSMNKIQQFSKEVEGGVMSDESMTEVSIILSLVVGKTVQEVDDLQITLKEMASAMEAIPELCGLEVKEVKSGEAQA